MTWFIIFFCTIIIVSSLFYFYIGILYLNFRSFFYWALFTENSRKILSTSRWNFPNMVRYVDNFVSWSQILMDWCLKFLYFKQIWLSNMISHFNTSQITIFNLINLIDISFISNLWIIVLSNFLKIKLLLSCFIYRYIWIYLMKIH